MQISLARKDGADNGRKWHVTQQSCCNLRAHVLLQRLPSVHWEPVSAAGDSPISKGRRLR